MLASRRWHVFGHRHRVVFVLKHWTADIERAYLSGRGINSGADRLLAERGERSSDQFQRSSIRGELPEAVVVDASVRPPWLSLIEYNGPARLPRQLTLTGAEHKRSIQQTGILRAVLALLSWLSGAEVDEQAAVPRGPDIVPAAPQRDLLR